MTFRSARILKMFALSMTLPLIFASSVFAVTNQITNPGAETGDFTGWTVVNAGDGWAMSDDAHDGGFAYVASFEYGTLTQVIDFSDEGYSDAFMDGEPELNFSTYVKGVANGSSTADFYMITVILYDESDVEITRFETGELTTTAEWLEVSTTFSNYGTGLRSASVELSGKDANWWLGNYGPLFDDTSLYFTREPSSGSVPFPVQTASTQETVSNTTENIFRDVINEDTHQTAVEYLYEKGAVEGYEVLDSDEKDFKPTNTINRAEFLKMTMLLTEADLAEGKNCFIDVKEEWFAPSVCSAFENGIVTGYDDETFKPDNTITYEEMVAIALRAYGFKLSSNENETWYQVFLDKAVELNAFEDLSMIVGQEVTRSEAAQLLYNIELFFAS